jgi:anti-anti-sigma regulatory factor
MLKIQRATNGETVFRLIGRMDVENVKELKEVFQAEARGRLVVLDLRDLVLVDQAAVKFLERCEGDRIELRNCPAYIREWITREREDS